jgi:hypothetical protein
MPRPTATLVIRTDVTNPLKTNPDADNTQDPGQEDDDRECAFEFALPAPTYDGPIGVPTETQSLAPPPELEPPRLNRDAERVDCYNSGAAIDRADAVDAIDPVCGEVAGRELDDCSDKTRYVPSSGTYYCDLGFTVCFVQLSMTVKNGCRFGIDGGEC